MLLNSMIFYDDLNVIYLLGKYQLMNQIKKFIFIINNICKNLGIKPMLQIVSLYIGV